MDGSAPFGRAVAQTFFGLMVVAAVSVPLAIWKLVDIAIWIAGHANLGRSS